MVTQNFIKLVLSGAGANATTQVDLDSLKTTYETNYFNIITLLNTSSVDITVLLDGQEVAFVPKSNGVFEIKPEYKLKFNFLSLKNETATNLTNEIKIILGVVGEI